MCFDVRSLLGRRVRSGRPPFKKDRKKRKLNSTSHRKIATPIKISRANPNNVTSSSFIKLPKRHSDHFPAKYPPLGGGIPAKIRPAMSSHEQRVPAYNMDMPLIGSASISSGYINPPEEHGYLNVEHRKRHTVDFTSPTRRPTPADMSVRIHTHPVRVKPHRYENWYPTDSCCCRKNLPTAVTKAPPQTQSKYHHHPHKQLMEAVKKHKCRGSHPCRAHCPTKSLPTIPTKTFPSGHTEDPNHFYAIRSGDVDPEEDDVAESLSTGDSKKGGLLPSEVKVLKQWYKEHHDQPYPTPTEKRKLARQCGISTMQVSCWFSNLRKSSRLSKRPKTNYHY